MAKMHTRKRGSSSSTRPLRTSSPEWVPIDAAEIGHLVGKMAKDGLSSAVIGTRLRDQYGVPNVKLATGKSVLALMKASGIKMEFPEDVRNLMKRAVHLSVHLSTRPKDLHNLRRLHNIEAKIRRLVKYYHDTGDLPKDWFYSLDTAKLLVD